jgi:hypothetical protein
MHPNGLLEFIGQITTAREMCDNKASVFASDGQILKRGTIFNDLLHGLGMRRGPLPNQLEVGNFIDDKLFGQNCYIFWTHTNNLAFAGEMNFGLKHNLGQSYFANGKLEFQGNYLYGVEHGLNCVSYHPDGSIKHSGEFKDGKFVGNSRNSAVNHQNFNISMTQNNNYFVNEKCSDCSLKHTAGEQLCGGLDSTSFNTNPVESRKKITRPGSAM